MSFVFISVFITEFLKYALRISVMLVLMKTC